MRHKVGKGRRTGLCIRQLHSGNGVETGGVTGAIRQQGAAQHAGIAGVIIRSHPTFIAEQHINPVPGEVFLAQQRVSPGGCAATGEGNAATIALIQHQADLGSNGV